MTRSYSKKEKARAGMRVLARGVRNTLRHVYELGQLTMVVFMHPLYIGTIALWGIFAFIDPQVGGQRIATLALSPSAAFLLGHSVLDGKDKIIRAYKDELEDTIPEKDMREEHER